MWVFPNQEERERVGEERRKNREGERKEGRNERKKERKRGLFSNTSPFSKVHQSTSPTFIQRVSKELILPHS